jgi:hypothetical protein
MVFFETTVFLLVVLFIGLLLFYFSRVVVEPMIKGILLALCISHIIFVMIFLVVPLGSVVIDYNSPGCEWLLANSTEYEFFNNQSMVNETITDNSWVNSCEERDTPRQYEVLYSFYLYYLLFLGMLILGSFVLYVVWLIRRWF